MDTKTKTKTKTKTETKAKTDGADTGHKKNWREVWASVDDIMTFLSDPTGNRRWLPFEVESIDSPRDKPFNYDGIYAQAYRLYRDGFTFWFTQDEVRQLARHNAYYETPRLENELVDQYFRKPTPSEPGEFMPVSVALQIIGSTLTQKLSAIMVGRVFKDMGFQSSKSNQVRGYIVVRRSSEEIAQRRQLLAICPICPSKDMIILTFKRFLLNTIMKAKSLQQIADSAGVSVRTLRRWLVPHKQQLASLGLKPSMKAIPPSAVKYIAEIFCLDIE